MGARVYTNMPAEDLMYKIKRAAENIRNKTSRNIRCPYCNHIALSVYSDSVGYIETKCTKCKKPVLIDLISMRRMNRYN